MMKIQRISLIQNLLIGCIPILLITTSGCALYSKGFDCKYEKGVGCKSITEVNQLVDQGQFQDSPQKRSQSKNINLIPSPNIFHAQGKIQRSPERLLSIWIAPHLDEQGDFHEASRIHTVIKPGSWQVLEDA